jgi:membrane protein required for colicin V production
MWLDFAIAAVIVGGILWGVFKGLVKAVASIVALVLGLVIASRAYPNLSRLLTFIKDHKVANIISFIVVFLIVAFLIGLAAWIVSKIIKFAQLGWLDRILGATFGLGFGILFSTLALSAALFLNPKFQSTINRSVVAQKVLELKPKFENLLPKGLLRK